MFNKIVLSLFLVTSSILYAKVNAVVSILPQQTFVEKIGGDKVHVTTMVKPGSDPHTYAPKPSQMMALSKADVYFPIKVEFEKAWLDKFTYHNQTMKISDMTKGIKFLKLQTAPYEWAGLFELEKSEYDWHFSKVTGEYADPKMKFLMLSVKGNDDLIYDYKEPAKVLFNKNKIIALEDRAILDKESTLYELHFDASKEQTTFTIDIQKSGKYLFFTEHMPFEFKNKEHYFKNMANSDVKAIITEPKNESAHHHHGGLDPHTWTAPSNVKIMAKNIYDTLCTLDTKNKNYYHKNYLNFLQEIEETDKAIKKIFKSLPKNSKFMVFHPSWGYFAKAYGLTQLSIEIEGKEPKPRMLQRIIKKARQEGIKAIFTQKEFSDKSAKTIAHALHIKVIKETPLAKDWSQNLIKKAKAIANNN
ncbi:MAG: Zinc ABC transporter, periplasmic-binding protein ZnuA [uncultured Sulfurovum sp.]|uniref:Zinc ABC transporter, periplasmic-binding protein ZnuA n=1 Tax=uncultured Sulfurovum sp. TaxID=269237 RepID=A0A6S6TWD4_9BACT|nr:MAG: Zinc ABC transporter, periplasmic-binding protein ZnuA [uncultured Sulfurovum sp.]